MEIEFNKDGGAWKMLITPINVKHPQSLKHVMLICKFTANDSRENMSAAIFHNGSLCKADIEDLIHRRCILLKIEIDNSMGVTLVTNTNDRHHRNFLRPLTYNYALRTHTPTLMMESP